MVESTKELLRSENTLSCILKESIESTDHAITAEAGDLALVDEIINEQNMQWAVSSFQPYKASGVDGIYPIMLQKGMGELNKMLLGIF